MTFSLDSLFQFYIDSFRWRRQSKFLCGTRDFRFVASFNVKSLQYSSECNLVFQHSKPGANTHTRSNPKWYPRHCVRSIDTVFLKPLMSEMSSEKMLVFYNNSYKKYVTLGIYKISFINFYPVTHKSAKRS